MQRISSPQAYADRQLGPPPRAPAGVRLTVGQVADACRAARRCLERGENPRCWTGELMESVAGRAGATNAAVVFPDSDALLAIGDWRALQRTPQPRGRQAGREALLSAARAAVARIAGRDGAGNSGVLPPGELPTPPPPTGRARQAADVRVGFALAWRDGRGRRVALLVGEGPAVRGGAVRADANPADVRRSVAGRLARVLARELAAAGRRLSHPGDPVPDALPRRARSVLHHWLDGLLEKEVAAILEISDGAVHKQVHRIYRHYDVTSRGQLQAEFLKRGWGRRREWRRAAPRD